MGDHDEVERMSGNDGLSLSRRALLRLGLLTVASTAPGLTVGAPGASAQTAGPGASLIGKLEGRHRHHRSGPGSRRRSRKLRCWLDLVKARELPTVQERHWTGPAGAWGRGSRDRQVRWHLASPRGSSDRTTRSGTVSVAVQNDKLLSSRLHGHPGRGRTSARPEGSDPGRQDYHLDADAGA